VKGKLAKHGVSSITTADLNGLGRFAERRNLVSARVSSHFNWPLHATRDVDGRERA
jgi:hypothetical protein